MDAKKLFMSILREKLSGVVKDKEDFSLLPELLEERLRQTLREALERQKEALLSSYIASLSHLAAFAIKDVLREKGTFRSREDLHTAVRVALEDVWKDMRGHLIPLFRFSEQKEKEVKARFIEKVMDAIREV